MSTPEDGWLHVGIDDDGSSVFVDPNSVRTHGLRLDRVEVTVVVKPAEGSDSLHAIKELLLKQGISTEDALYAEQSWVLHLPGKLFSIRNLTVKSRDGAALHTLPLSSIDLNTIEPGSVADQVSETVEKLVQERSLTLQVPDATLPTDPVPSQTILPRGTETAMPGYSTHRLSFQGSGLRLFEIYIVNIFLTIITLGTYSFWGRVKVRKFLVGETQLGDERFRFHGTGRELLRGWMKAMLVFGLPFIVLRYLPQLTRTGVGMRQVMGALSSLIVVLFIPMAMVGARRYRLSRTSWREIRFSFRGKTWSFVKLYLVGAFLTVITLGLYKPFFDTRTYNFMATNSHFGNRPFTFDGKGRDLFRPFLLAWLLTIPTLGIYWFWYAAQKQRFLWEYTSFKSLRFSSTVTGGALLGLHALNLLLIIVTIGLAWPWVKVRKARFLFKYLRLRGPFDPDSIIQEAQAASPTGEALASFFDMDFDLG